MKPYKHRRSGKPRTPQQRHDYGKHVLESTSGKGKIRGTARQLGDRYLQFAEEARLANDRVAFESFSQSAEHYVRLGNPTLSTDPLPVKPRPHLLPPTGTETYCSMKNPCITPPVHAMPVERTTESDPVSSETKPMPDVAESEEQTAFARRSEAAADLERVAEEHGFTLAQLGLVLRI